MFSRILLGDATQIIVQLPSARMSVMGKDVSPDSGN